MENTTMTLDIPFDILETIMYFLANSFEEDRVVRDIASLKTCALAARVLLPLARRHIFEYIIINHRRHHTYQLNELLDRTPIIATYIRHASYRVPESLPGDEEIVRLMGRFPNIVGLTFIADNPMRWLPVPAEAPIIATLRRTFALPSFKMITIEGFFDFPITFLGMIAPNIDCLKLRNTGFLQIGQLSAAGIIDNNSDMLRLGGVQPFPRKLSFRNLKDLSVDDFNQPNNEELVSLIQGVAFSLKSLSLTCNMRETLPNIPFSALKYLDTFNLSLYINTRSVSTDDTLLGLADALVSAQGRMLMLKQIHIKMRIECIADFAASAIHWSNMDSVLTGAKFPALEHVSLDIDISTPHRRQRNYRVPSLGEVETLAAASFGGLFEAGPRIRFEFHARCS